VGLHSVPYTYRKNPMPKQARILSAVELDGQTYLPNQVVEFSDKTAKALCADGQVDTDPASVAYCINDLGAVAMKHTAAEPEQAADDVTA
jgi:hypothetical protein